MENSPLSKKIMQEAVYSGMAHFTIQGYRLKSFHLISTFSCSKIPCCYPLAAHQIQNTITQTLPILTYPDVQWQKVREDREAENRLLIQRKHFQISIWGEDFFLIFNFFFKSTSGFQIKNVELICWYVFLIIQKSQWLLPTVYVKSKQIRIIGSLKKKTK